MVLTLDEAERMVRHALAAPGSPDATILRERTSERPFGWVLAAAPASNARAPDPADVRLVIVNKYSREILATSSRWPFEMVVDGYERLLKDRARDWCLTMAPWSGLSRHRQYTRLLETLGLTILASSAPSSDVGAR